MKIPAALKYSHVLLKQVVQRGDNVIDATMGNGNDTAFLAKLVGDHGNVYAFDIQDQALQKTKQRLIKSNLTKSVTLYHTGHQHILDTIGMTSISAAIFNLGYLPGGNKKNYYSTDNDVKCHQTMLNDLTKRRHDRSSSVLWTSRWQTGKERCFTVC